MKNDTCLDKKKNILFTVWYANGFHGAVIHISDIAEYLLSQGWNVYCVCVDLTSNIKDYFTTKGIKVYSLDSFDYDIEYDLIWNIHFPIFVYLLKNQLKYKKVIFNSLSSFLEIESPPVFYDDYPLLLAVSEETKDNMINSYNIPPDKVKILYNVVPQDYFKQHKSCNESVKKVVIVSNHVPQELLDCVDLFKERNIKCDIIGKKYVHIPITPEILQQYDVVISIGKTVQYSLALGVPCYNYDYFGGSGYITEKNIKIEEYYNFSGRSYKTQKTSSEIVSEIIDGYSDTLKSLNKLKEYAGTQYSVSAQIKPIMEYIETLPYSKVDLQKYSIIIDQYYFLLKEINKYCIKKRKSKHKKKKSLLKKLFYIKYENSNKAQHKVICFLGIKIKIKCV